MVCHAGSMVGLEKIVGEKILHCSVCVALGMGLATIPHRDSMRMYLDCMGRSEWFLLNLANIFSPSVGGTGIRLGFFNPFRLIANINIFSFILLVPCLYLRIFIFRNIQDRRIAGKITRNIIS